MKRPVRGEHAEQYICMLEVYANFLEDQLAVKKEELSDASWENERLSQHERDNFGNEWL